MLRLIFAAAIIVASFSTAHAFQFEVQHSRKCLDVRSASLSDRALIIQWYCKDPAPRHQWLIPIEYGGDLVSIEVRVTSAGGRKCLDVSGGRPLNRAAIIQYRCHYGPNQLWQLDYINSPYTFRIRSALDRSKCIDVYRASHTDGAPVILFDCHPANSRYKNQIFHYKGL